MLSWQWAAWSEEGRASSLGLSQLPYQTVPLQNKAAECPLSSPQLGGLSFPAPSVRFTPARSFCSEEDTFDCLGGCGFFPADGVWTLLLKQTWLEILLGAWLCIKNVPPNPHSILLSSTERPVKNWLRGSGRWPLGQRARFRGVALELGPSQTHRADLFLGDADAAHATAQKTHTLTQATDC